MAEQPSSPTVTVGCKLPHGIHMDIFDANGNRSARFTLRGNNSAAVIGGFGITENVPRAHFERWMEQNKFHPAVKNGLIFAHAQGASVESYAKENALQKNGLEPLDPTKPAKMVSPAEAERDTPQAKALEIDTSVAPYHPKPLPQPGMQ